MKSGDVITWDSRETRVKTCVRCKESKVLRDFGFNYKYPDRRHYTCKKCTGIKHKD